MTFDLLPTRPQASIMTGSALSLGVDGHKPPHGDPLGPAGMNSLQKGPLLHEGKNKNTLRVSDKTWESRRIKEEMQEILSPTPLELLKVPASGVCFTDPSSH